MTEQDKRDVIEVRFNTYYDKHHKRLKSAYRLPVLLRRYEAMEIRDLLQANPTVGFVDIHLSGNRVI